MAPATEAEPRFDPFIGQLVGGRSKIAKLLGEGGMGAVYLGEQNIGGKIRKVAVKTLHAHLSKDPKILTRFERECATVAELQHPNTIQLFDFGKTDDGILYMVMEFVQGESLAAVLEKNRSLEPVRALHILQQICDALGEAHTLGIVHRDLKPENIVLTERAKDWVKVLDFGIAKRSEAPDKEEQKLTQQGTVLGTPPYMSPEQFTGRPIDSRSDIYSIAMIGYEMLAGKLPFTAATPWEWATQHMTVAPQPLSVTPSGGPIPEVMVYAIMRSLSKDPAERFGTTREFFEAMCPEGFSLTGGYPLAVSGGYAMAPASMVAGSAFAAAAVANGAASAVLAAGAPPSMGVPSGGLSPAPVASIGGGTGAMQHPSLDPLPSGEGRGKTQIGEPTPGAMSAMGPYGPGANPLAATLDPATGVAPALRARIDAPPPPRRGRGGAGAVIALLAFAGLLAAGGIVFALTRSPKHHGSKDTPLPNGQSTTVTDDAGGGSATNDTPPHMPLIDTSLPSLPTNGNGAPHTTPSPTTTTPPTPTTPPANEPHACKSARTLQTRLSQATNPSMKMLNQFNHERAKCISEGGHL